MNRRTFVKSGLSLLALAAARPSLALKTAGIKMIPVGKYQVWTKQVGAGPTRMLTLHGGPGCTHEYLECFEDFLPQHGIGFYYYDQLGSAYSDQPDDPSLWRIDRFREEVEEVRRGLGLQKFWLYGHSWGAMLAIEYALKYPQNIKGLILSSMTASIASYVTYMNELRHRIPADKLAVIEKYEKRGSYDAPEYQDVIMKELYAEHICRLDPWPEPVARMFKHMNGKVYNAMQGPNEFVVVGNLKGWDRWKDLPSIKAPTLLTVGEHDEMRVADIERMGKLIPHSRVFVGKGSHLSMWDDQENYFRALLGFVDDVEKGRFPA
jgi:proline iminopeptidase